MKRLHQFNEFIKESAQSTGLGIIKMSVTYLFEGARVSGPIGILSIQNPRDKHIKIEDNEGDFYEELDNMCDYLESKFGPAPYKMGQFRGKGLERYMSEMYMDNARTEGSRIYLDIEELDAKDILAMDPGLQDQVLGISEFPSANWVTIK
jgi:hypothetical protein